jgi:mannose-6-phosphate isomerase-like protein (cupin superfamily)
MEQNQDIINCPANQEEVVQLKELAVAWKTFYKENKYRNLMAQSTPIVEGCGIIHELKNASIFRTRQHETACIVDMSKVNGATEPHFHRNETEIYLILHGTGTVAIGQKEYSVKPGDVVYIPKHVGHYTVPTDNLVLGVVNVPFFDPADFFDLIQADEATRNNANYDHARYLYYKNK